MSPYAVQIQYLRVIDSSIYSMAFPTLSKDKSGLILLAPLKNLDTKQLIHGPNDLRYSLANLSLLGVILG